VRDCLQNNCGTFWICYLKNITYSLVLVSNKTIPKQKPLQHKKSIISNRKRCFLSVHMSGKLSLELLSISS